MSLIPANRECPDCGGYMVAGLPGGRTLSSRCRCSESRLIDTADPPELKPDKRAGWVR